ncbi:MAG: MFS transporter [Actinomycetota bacterium]|nr:MFS transporter [Actinomycetota bacterium]
MLADTVPLYPLYALLFVDTGLSGADISGLFVIWATVGFVAEVPSGALADRFSRRGVLVAAGVLQAGGYALWIALPGFSAFAAGFALWGLGGALVSGALEALLYDGLAVVGAEAHYARVQGRVTAVGLLAQLPAAAAATVLFSLGGYDLAGWVSVGCCLAAAALASRLPEPPREPTAHGAADPTGYLTTLRAGLTEAAARPEVRAAVLAVAVLAGLDGLEEYFTLLARDWGMPTPVIPVAVLGIPLAGAAGAALGGVASRLGPSGLAVLLGAAAALLGGAGLVGHPPGLAGVAVFYGLYQLVLVVADARLQQRINGPARATVTSVAGLGSELATVVLYAAWALGEVALVAALVLLVAAVLPRWLRAGGSG